MNRRLIAALAAVLAVTAAPAGAQPAGSNCRNTQDYGAWLAAFKQEALAKGVSPRAWTAAAPQLVFTPGIISRDRGQRFFAQDFTAFAGKMLMPYRLQKGPQLIRQHAALFQRIEREFGVPAPVLVGFWGLESDFGAGMGKLPVLPSLATLAYDCRRPDMFRPELLDALRLIDRGDLTPQEMIGSWAGELGQTQFLPTLYYKYGLDYDGDGRRDLIRSVPDVLASTANYLRDLGWRRGEPWLQEVRVPAELPWDLADLEIQHPRAQWARWGVTKPDGSPLEGDNRRASLLLPMGRNGPAFLAFDNFKIYTTWNNSLVYATTAAYYATRLAGAPAMRKGNGPVASFSREQLMDLQRRLTRRGHNVGAVDGILGAQTRAAIKVEQMKLGLPADSYPSPDLFERLR